MEPPKRAFLKPGESANFTSNCYNFPSVKQEITKQKNQIRETKRKIDDSITNLYLCHATSYFPDDGVIRPRLNYSIDESSKSPTAIILEKIFSIMRPTLHFTVNSLVESHEDYYEENKQRFIIIERLQDAGRSILGGTLEDVFCIGHYKLSENAVILTPESSKNKAEVQEKIKKLNGRVEIIYYPGSDDQAFKDYSKEKKIKLMKPCQTDHDTTNYFHYIGDNFYASSESLMKKLKKIFCEHALTPTAQIEIYINTNTIYHVPPFLRSSRFESYKEREDLIKNYVSETKKIYKLNAIQKSFMHVYEEAILTGIKMLYDSKTNEDLFNNFKCSEEFLLNYDAQIDLDQKIEGHDATKALAKLTELNFIAYQRKKCSIVVDAAYFTNLSEVESEKSRMILTTKYAFNFILEDHSCGFYIVLKGVHLPEIHKKILKANEQK